MEYSSVWLVIINLSMQALLFHSVNHGFNVLATGKSCFPMLVGYLLYLLCSRSASLDSCNLSDAMKTIFILIDCLLWK